MRFRESVMLAVLLSALFLPLLSHAQGRDNLDKPSVNSSNPIEGLFRGISRIVETALSTKDSDFKALIDGKKYREAADYYAKEREYFDKDKSRYSEDLKSISTGLNNDFSSKFLKVRNLLIDAIDSANRDTGNEYQLMARLVAAENAAGQELKPYDEIVLFSNMEYRSIQAVELEDLIKKSHRLVNELSPKAFANFDHFQGKSFFQDLTLPVSRSQFLADNLPIMEGRLSQLDSSKIEVFLDTYQADFNDSEKKKIARLQIEAVHREAAGMPSIANAVKAQELSKKYGVDLERPELQLVELVSEAKGSEKVALEINNDVGIGFVKSAVSEAISIVDASDSPLTIFVEVASSETSRNVVSRREENSRFEAGTRKLPNPEYEVARQKYLQAEDSYRQTQLRNSLSGPAQNWGQLLGRALGEAGGGVVRNQAFQAFQATPATIDETIYTPYTFRVSEIEVKKSAAVIVTAVDPKTRRFWRAEREFSEARKFEMAFNVNARDENRYGNSTKYVGEEELAKYESMPVKWSASEIIDVVKKDEGEAVQFVSASSVLNSTVPKTNPLAAVINTRSLTTEQLIEDDPRSESVVVVLNPNGGLGAGFFVESNLIITNYHVVEGASFAEVKLKNGKITYGKVLRTDPARDLALIRVSEQGVPVNFSEDRLFAGQQVEAIGHPNGLYFSLTRGVVSAVRKRSVPEIGEVLFIQTDTPISPGNSGGPLFSKDRVIGVNTMKFASKGVEGLSFAIHATELRSFLSKK